MSGGGGGGGGREMSSLDILLDCEWQGDQCATGPAP